MTNVQLVDKPALDIEGAFARLKSVVNHTPLQFNANYPESISAGFI